MPEITPQRILQALEEVIDPDLGISIVAMGMIKDIQIDGAKVAFTCELTTPACPLKAHIESDIRQTLARAVPEITSVDVKMTGRVRNMPGQEEQPGKLLPLVKNVVMIGAGKGGVGKSICALNLALALKRTGARVGVLDADIYAPALPILASTRQRPSLAAENTIRPVEVFSLESMSMGYLVDPQQPMLWRGPSINGIIVQFLRDVTWGELDYMIVDLPPGPADVSLAVAQSCSCAGVVLISTPQVLAGAATLRAKALFDQMGIGQLGLIENLAPADGSSTAGTKAAGVLQIPFLGAIPSDPAIAHSADAGAPIVAKEPESPAAKAFIAAAEKLAAQISVRNLSAAPKS
jgi:ATP-binding protein involved in chromosome partitioning